MNSHGIEVLDRTNDHTIVRLVSHHLHLEFLPTEQRLLNQNFTYGRQLKAAFGDFFELLPVIPNAPTGPSQRIGRANDKRQTVYFFRDVPRFVQGMSRPANRHIQSD